MFRNHFRAACIITYQVDDLRNAMVCRPKIPTALCEVAFHRECRFYLHVRSMADFYFSVNGTDVLFGGYESATIKPHFPWVLHDLIEFI